MSKPINDFSRAADNIIKEQASVLIEQNTIKARKADPVKYPKNTVKVKIIDRFNYVTHVYFTTDDQGLLQSFQCDGSGRYCGNSFCEHCAAAYEYLKNSEEFSVVLPQDNETDDEDSDEDDDSDDDSDKNTYEDENGLQDYDDIDNDREKDTYTDEDENGLQDYDDIDNDRKEDTYTDEDENGFQDDDDTDNDRKEDTYTDEDENGFQDDDDIDNAREEDTCTESNDEPLVPKSMKILLGTDKKTGEPIYLMPNDTDQVLNNNIGIIGTMGTGKTQFTKSLVSQLCRAQADNFDGTPLGILIFDYKGDYNESKPDFMEMTKAKVIQPYRMPFNPLSLNLKENNNKALLPKHTANAFKDTLSKIYNLGPKQEGILFDCIMSAYEKQGIDPGNKSTWKRPAPTFNMVYEEYKQSNSFNDNDKLAVVMKKLEGFEIFTPDPMKAVPLSKLLRGVVVIDISDYDEDIQNLVVAITLDLFYAQMQTFGSSKTNGRYRQLKTFILVDEADNFMKMGFPSLRKIMKEGREFGVGIILSTQSLTHFCTGEDDYSKYIITWVIHKVNDLNRRNIEAVLNQAQKSMELEDTFLAIKELKKHESIVKISGNEPAEMNDKPFWELYKEETGER